MVAWCKRIKRLLRTDDPDLAMHSLRYRVASTVQSMAAEQCIRCVTRKGDSPASPRRIPLAVTAGAVLPGMAHQPSQPQQPLRTPPGLSPEDLPAVGDEDEEDLPTSGPRPAAASGAASAPRAEASPLACEAASGDGGPCL